MPIIAESPPMIFGNENGSPEPEPTEEPIETPEPTPEIKPVLSYFVEDHKEFMDLISNKSCFKKEDISDFTDQQILDHIELAIQDKYISKTSDIYCTMKGVHDLTKALKRVSSEQEIII